MSGTIRYLHHHVDMMSYSHIIEASPDTAWLQRSSASLNGWLVSPEYYYYYDNNNHKNNNGGRRSESGSLLLFPVGVSDVDSTGRMTRHKSSPGMTTFASSNYTKDEFKLQPGINGSALNSDIKLVKAGNVLDGLGLGINNKNMKTITRPKEGDVCYRLLKIDVEGYEMKALRGLDLTNYPFESIIMEYFPIMLKSAGLNRPMELLEYIGSFGYEFYIIESKNGSITKVTLEDDMFQKSWVKNDHINLLAKKI